MLNKFGPSGHGEAQVQYLDGDFRVISPGTYVRCAVTDVRIPLDELKYWSVDLQEAYAVPTAVLQRHFPGALKTSRLILGQSSPAELFLARLEQPIGHEFSQARRVVEFERHRERHDLLRVIPQPFAIAQPRKILFRRYQRQPLTRRLRGQAFDLGQRIGMMIGEAPAAALPRCRWLQAC